MSEIPTDSAFRRRTALGLLAILALTFACYGGALAYGFVYDDGILILENPSLRSWRNVPHYFVEHLRSHDMRLGSNYRPVLQIWMFANYSLFGAFAPGWHLTTLLMHLAGTALVYATARRLTEGATPLLAALIFGLHPVHVEAVAWIMGVTESLAVVLLLGALLCYFRSRPPERGAARWRGGALALAALGCMAKETTLALPALIFAYEWFLGEAQPARRFWSRFATALRPAVPFAILCVVYLAVRFVVLGGWIHPVTPLPASTALLSLPSALWAYLKLLVWPFGLSAFYDTPYVTAATREFWLPLARLAAAALLALWTARRSPVAAFLILWMVLPMLPVLNFAAFPTGETVHDRYLYMTSIGFSILLAMGLRRMPAWGAQFRGEPVLRWAAGAVLLTAFAAGAYVQKGPWRSDFELYSHGYRTAPNNLRVANNLAGQFLTLRRYDEARNIFQRILARDPDFWLAHHNLAVIAYLQGNFTAAERGFARAAELRPAFSDAHFQLGRTLLRLGRAAEAEAAVRRALEWRPQGPGYHFALAEALEAQGRWREAIAEFQAELALDPENTVPRFRIQRIEQRLGRN